MDKNLFFLCSKISSLSIFKKKSKFFLIEFLTFSKIKSFSLWAPPNGSEIISSIIFNSKRSLEDNFIAFEASNVFLGSLHNIVAHPSGDITE